MTRDAFAGRLDISVSREDGAVVVRGEGEVDLDTAEQLASALRGAVTDTDGLVVLDLLGVPFMDSSGLKVLLVAAAELGERLVLAISPGSPVMTLLELAEVRDRFTVCGTPQEAMTVRRGSSE
jgi:anti-anti-sigma factor